jgi:hypothetical protein
LKSDFITGTAVLAWNTANCRAAARFSIAAGLPEGLEFARSLKTRVRAARPFFDPQEGTQQRIGFAFLPPCLVRLFGRAASRPRCGGLQQEGEIPMGLDMFALTMTEKPASEVDFVTEQHSELRYWRKHPDLHGWMEKLYREKGGTAESFNCVRVVLAPPDLDRLEADIKESKSAAYPKRRASFSAIQTDLKHPMT